eukprot:TRINITY_DN3616_c0_g1_i1.p1 TRINITY_DN3616_c0_g1~~TRINITY_DN3616_c0_g1_i1.p1  ORF type:complete len:154 (-),score=47.65 TRINITY_DN3616_c0_g1_i1:53-514(-)
MVNLTRSACARLTPVMNSAEDLLAGRAYGRKNIQDKNVAFIERLPLSLKNLVSNQSTKDSKKACMDPMMEVISCLSKYDQNQSMCSKEIGSFEKCFKTFTDQQQKTKAFRESGELPIGPRAKMSGAQMNQYMKNFPASQRTGEFLPTSAYKKK